MPMQPHLAPRRALYHPLWLTSLGLLVLNDHLFKGSGKLPAVVTGKLSDFAGLLVAPILLAVLLRLSSRRAIVLAHLATGAVFAGIKISPAFARFFETIAGLGPFSWHITVDPTDLIALPVLFVSYVVFVRAAQEPVVESPVAQRGLVIVGSVACMATSPAPPPPTPCPDDFCGAIPTEPASIVIGNVTDTERLVRVRALKDSVQVRCSDMLVDPTTALSRELFGPADAWLLQPGRGLPLQNSSNAECAAYLVDADGLSPTLIAWSAAQFPQTMLSTSTTAPSGNTMINLALDVTGKLALDEMHPAVFDAPALESPQPSGLCAPPDKGVGVAWSTPLPGDGSFKIVSVDSSPDDCHLIVLENSPSMYVCVPVAAMPFKAGDSFQVQSYALGSGSFPETNGEAPAGNVLIMRSGTHAVIALRGNVLARYAFLNEPEPLTEPTVEVDRTKGCSGSHDECGGLIIPAEVSYLGDHVDMITFLRAGTSLALKDGYGTLHVVRAEARPIRDTECPPFARASQHYESVLVVPTVP